MKSGMEQAVCILILLARLPSRAVLKSESISERLEVSPSYLKKLMRVLVRAGLVNSTPGVKGGFSLAKNPEEITLYDIFQAVEGRGSLYQGRGVFTSVFTCQGKQAQEKCILDSVMKRAESAWIQALNEETLATLLNKVNSAYRPEHLSEMDAWIQSQIHGEEIS